MAEKPQKAKRPASAPGNAPRCATPWCKVKTTDYYGEWESPVKSGIELKIHNRMPICVRWPDGTTTRETLVVMLGSDSAQVDMNNHPDYFRTRHLFVKTQVHGVKLAIPLFGLQICGAVL
jgi:hypothetical protein